MALAAAPLAPMYSAAPWAKTVVIAGCRYHKTGHCVSLRSASAERGGHVTAELLLELFERDAKCHWHGAVNRFMRSQCEHETANPFFTVARSHEVEHGMRPMTIR